MTTSHEKESATILHFPARGRFAAPVQGEDMRPVANMPTARLARVASGSSWYHDEAIRDAERTR